MSLVEEIKKLEGLDVGLYLGAFLATIGPGFLLIFMYKPELIESLDTVKVILFSASIGFPLFALNAFITLVLSKKNEEIDFHDAGLTSGTITSIAFYTTLLTAYYLSPSTKEFIPTLLAINFMAYTFTFFAFRDKEEVERK